MFAEDVRHEDPAVGSTAVGGTAVLVADAARWVGAAGLAVMALSAFGGVFPYFSHGVGLPLDGAPDGAMTTWRTALHLVPAVVGLLAGAGLVRWGLRRPRGATARGPELAARTGVVVGAWFAVGPYLWALVQPGQSVGTGGLAGAMTDAAAPHMSWISSAIMPMTRGLPARMTTASCAFTMGVDHWAVGGLVVLASLAALGAGAGRGPLASLAGHRAG